MKMSEYFRKWQVSGELPEGLPSEFHIWAGWILGSGTPAGLANLDDKLEMAIQACEFIENQK